MTLFNQQKLLSYKKFWLLVIRHILVVSVGATSNGQGWIESRFLTETAGTFMAPNMPFPTPIFGVDSLRSRKSKAHPSCTLGFSFSVDWILQLL